MKRYIAVDPGYYKCGIVMTDLDLGIVLDGKVVTRENLMKVILDWKSESDIEQIILGNGTSSKFYKELLSKFFLVKLVEERGTTFRARARYWDLWPPKGWKSILPRSILIPDEQLDAIAALVLFEDYFGTSLNWHDKPSFKILL